MLAVLHDQDLAEYEDISDSVFTDFYHMFQFLLG